MNGKAKHSYARRGGSRVLVCTRRLKVMVSVDISANKQTAARLSPCVYIETVLDLLPCSLPQTKTQKSFSLR